MNRLDLIRSCALSALALAVSHSAQAVTADEAAHLGTSLTPWGAEKGPSADGLIPAYTGGNTTPPAGFVAGSGHYPDPYVNEKPSVSINAANLGQYADKITPGIQALMKRYPTTYRIDVYPTHRSFHYPDFYLSHCKDNALHARLTNDGNGFTGAYSCVPFPIPKTGLELLWNMLVHDATGTYVAQIERFDNYMVDSAGNPISVGNTTYLGSIPYLDPASSELTDGYFAKDVIKTNSPAAQAGTKILTWYTTNFDAYDELDWLYQVGQRRVRVAPEFRFDTPIAQYGGVVNWDERNGFAGNPGRFDWKIVGKKEIYVPANDYKAMFGVEPLAALGPNFQNPDALRWELHRVWILEADLKEGIRHIESKRILYIDEDSLNMVLSDGYDHSGALLRLGLQLTSPYYDDWGSTLHFVYYDLSKNYYMVTGLFGDSGSYSKHLTVPANTTAFTPDGLMSSSFQ